MERTSKYHFELFKKEFKKYISMFGLVGWDIEFAHCELVGAMATCAFSGVDRLATISLNTVFYDVSDMALEVKKCAFHEALELLMSPLSNLAVSRNWNEDMYTKENHSIIRTLENLYFGI